MITLLSDEKTYEITQDISEKFSQTINTKHFPLQNFDIKPCYGCGGCEKKTYLRCIVRDDLDLIMPYLVRSDTIVIVTYITYGSYSFQIKRILDKFAPLTVGIHYGYNKGELVKGIHSTGPPLYVIGIHDNTDQAEIQVFEHLVLETLNIASWDGKPIIISLDSFDLKNIMREIVI